MFEDALSGTIAAIKSGAKIVVAIPDPRHRQDFDKIKKNKNKTTLIILKSLDEFNFSLINSSNM